MTYTKTEIDLLLLQKQLIRKVNLVYKCKIRQLKQDTQACLSVPTYQLDVPISYKKGISWLDVNAESLLFNITLVSCGLRLLN